MYCPECGHKIDDASARFCPECGTRLESPAEDPATATDMEDSAADEKDGQAYGIIFTNLSLLAGKLRSDIRTVAEILKTFIDRRKRSSVRYKLVDAGNYSFAKSGIFSRSRTVSLNAASPVTDYLEILMDVHEREEKKAGAVSDYLFIIGGADIIPVPRIRHYFAQNSNDKTIDTDLLYAYPYNNSMVAALEDMEAFGYEQLFHVGRLPLGEDAVIQDLSGYLQRVLDSSGVIGIGESYGQCDPNWKKVSATVATELIANSLMRNLDGRLGDEYYFSKLILSPMVTKDNVSKVLHTGADLYYFNLHGGSGAESRGFFGANTPEKGGKFYTAILPEHMMTLEKRNVVISEACYGGKFIGLDKRRSMLLASLFTNTLAFVGSSRIAYGAVDSTTNSDQCRLYSADVIACVFISSALQGYDAGQSLAIARSALLQECGWGDPYAALTITEFNLYGDPALLMYGHSRENGKAAFKTAGKTAIAPKGMQKDACNIEDIEQEDRQASILAQVRGAVNANIMDIHAKISRYLYSNYSVEPRKLDSAFRLRYQSGKEELVFNYKFPAGEDGMETQYTVSASTDGEIKKVFTTK